VTAPGRPHAGYGLVQLAAHLGLERWQLSRAVHGGLIGGPDLAGGRWSAAAAAAALARAGQIRAAAGSVSDLGAVRAAGVLSERLGVTVTADGVEELARRGLLPVAGSYKGWPLYDGRVLEGFTDAAAAAGATRAGELRTADQSAAYLRIRRSDLRHLTRCGLLAPAKWGRGPWDRRDTCSVPLYRTGDLDQLAARPGIDWAAVRAAPPGRRSPLKRLADAETVLACWRPWPARRPGHERRHVHVLRDPDAVADQGAGPAVRGLPGWSESASRSTSGRAPASRFRSRRPGHEGADRGRARSATAATEAAIEDGDLVGIYLAAEAEEAAYAQVFTGPCETGPGPEAESG